MERRTYAIVEEYQCYFVQFTKKNIIIVLFIYLAYLIFLLAVPEFASFFSESVMFDTPREQGILSLAIVGKNISQN